MSSIINENNRQEDIIMHNLTDIIRNLGKEYNIKNNIYNEQEELLQKYNYYLDIQNKKLNRQLNNIHDLQNNITTRDSLVRINNEEFQKKNKFLLAISFFFLLLGYLVVIIVAFLSKQISFTTLISNLIIIIILYIVYILWYFDFLGLRDFTTFTENELETARKDLIKEGRRIENNINQFVNKNCLCPTNSKSSSDENNRNQNQNQNSNEKLPKYFAPLPVNKNTAFFYDDGNAPQQRVVPPIVPQYSFNKPKNLEGNFSINWIDRQTRDKIKTKNNNKNQCSRTPSSNEEKIKKFWTVDL